MSPFVEPPVVVVPVVPVVPVVVPVLVELDPVPLVPLVPVVNPLVPPVPVEVTPPPSVPVPPHPTISAATKNAIRGAQKGELWRFILTLSYLHAFAGPPVEAKIRRSQLVSSLQRLALQGRMSKDEGLGIVDWGLRIVDCRLWIGDWGLGGRGSRSEGRNPPGCAIRSYLTPSPRSGSDVFCRGHQPAPPGVKD